MNILRLRTKAFIAVTVALVGLRPAIGSSGGDEVEYGAERPEYVAGPTVVVVADLPAGVDEAAVTDIAVLDFDDDGLNDIAVAWYANDPNSGALLRFLSLYVNGGGTNWFPLADIDLYRPSNFAPPLDDSIFATGTDDIIIGDFDGDGDDDIAVTPYFSSELWLIENKGGGAYQAFPKYMFGQFGGGFVTPPEGVAGDFDGDGRDELAYLVNVTPHFSGPIHIWDTADSIANMQLVSWEGLDGSVATTANLGLAAGDFDMDGRADLAFGGLTQINGDPVLIVWYGLDVQTEEFAVAVTYLRQAPGDLISVRSDKGCGRDLLISDSDDGSEVEKWVADCNNPVRFTYDRTISGLAGKSAGRGVMLSTGDVNGDGLIDLVTKQRSGEAGDSDQIEFALREPDTISRQFLVYSDIVDTTSYEDDGGNQILRPRSLAVRDLYGSRLPEVVTAFAPPVSAGMPKTLEFLVWSNGCPGDVNGDGVVGVNDLAIVLNTLGCGGAGFDPAADLNRDGCIDVTDLNLVLADFGCVVDSSN